MGEKILFSTGQDVPGEYRPSLVYEPTPPETPLQRLYDMARKILSSPNATTTKSDTSELPEKVTIPHAAEPNASIFVCVAGGYYPPSRVAIGIDDDMYITVNRCDIESAASLPPFDDYLLGRLQSHFDQQEPVDNPTT